MKKRTTGAVLSATLVSAGLVLAIAVTRSTHVPAFAGAPVPTKPPEISTPLKMAASSALSTSTSPSPPPAPQPSPEAAVDVRTAVRKSVPSATVGVEVYDRDTGTVLTSLDADEQFPSMSVVKLFIAIDVLHQDNWAPPDATTQQELTRMISASDDAIASALWSEDGGPEIIERDVRLLGLTDTEPPTDSGEWGDTLTTPKDLVTTYRYITDHLPPADHDLLFAAMSDASQTAADGFDQYFGIPNGLPGTTWAIKQGWGSSGPDAEMNTTGLIGTDSRYIVIVLGSAPLSDYSRLPAALTDGTAELSGLVSGP